MCLSKLNKISFLGLFFVGLSSLLLIHCGETNSPQVKPEHLDSTPFPVASNLIQSNMCQEFHTLNHCNADCNEDGLLNAQDIQCYRKYILTVEDIDTINPNLFYDFNNSGTLTTFDLILFTRYLNGQIDESNIPGCECFDLVEYPDEHPCSETNTPENTHYADFGQGTPLDPYLIYSSDALASIDVVSGFFQQCTDIDLSDYYSKNSPYFSVGGDYFSGSYNGNNFAIKGFTIDEDQPQFFAENYNTVRPGLFHALDYPADIRNLKIQDLYIKMTSESYGPVGGLVAKVYWGDVQIENLHLDGTIQGHTQVGGLIGDMNGGHIENVHSNVSLRGESHVGGLVGQLRITNTGEPLSIYIRQSSSLGEIVSAVEYVGGFLGSLGEPGSDPGNFASVILTHNEANVAVNASSGNSGGFAGLINEGTSIVDLSTSSGTVNCQSSFNCGGFVGNMRQGGIHRSLSNSNVVGFSKLGGFVGNMDDQPIIEDSYATGSVTGRRFIGGFVGNSPPFTFIINDAPSIKRAYASGDIFHEGDSEAAEGIGGFLGGAESIQIRDSFSANNIVADAPGNSTFGHFYGLIGLTLLSNTSAYLGSCPSLCNTESPLVANLDFFYNSNNSPFNNWIFDAEHWVETDVNNDGIADGLPQIPSAGIP